MGRLIAPSANRGTHSAVLALAGVGQAGDRAGVAELHRRPACCPPCEIPGLMRAGEYHSLTRSQVGWSLVRRSSPPEFPQSARPSQTFSNRRRSTFANMAVGRFGAEIPFLQAFHKSRRGDSNP